MNMQEEIIHRNKAMSKEMNLTLNIKFQQLLQQIAHQ
jgi:hypothetical protein